jgi:SAM-dependent methyltransferase
MTGGQSEMGGGRPEPDGFEDRAENWLRWARAPGFDAYWLYRDSFFSEVVPPPGNATLEIGCGEGRVARDLLARGHRVVAVDASPTLVEAAVALDPHSEYRVANAEALPFEDGQFDLVVAYNSLMDVDDMPKAVAEAARVMTPQGRLVVCVTHPVSDSGDFVHDGEDAPFQIPDTYFGARTFHFHAERDGLTMDFDGWAFDLESYSKALEVANLGIELIREPQPSGEDRLPRRRRIPNFLMFRALRLTR